MERRPPPVLPWPALLCAYVLRLWEHPEALRVGLALTVLSALAFLARMRPSALPTTQAG